MRYARSRVASGERRRALWYGRIMSDGASVGGLGERLGSPAHRRVQSILLICLVTWLAFTVLNGAQRRAFSASIDLAVTLTLLLVRRWARADERRAAPAAHLGALLNGVGLTAVSLIQGQSAAVASWFLVTSPLYAGFTLGLRGARLWSGLSIVMLAVVHFSGYAARIRPEFEQLPFEAWLGATVLVLAIFAFAAATLRVQEQDLAAIRARNELIERHSEELERARDAAVAGARARDDFLALMSHEVRTPLTGILGMAELLADGAGSAEQREQAETIRSCGDALRVVLDDILDAAKIEAGKLAMELRPFGLRTALAQVVQLQRANADEKGLALALRVADDVPDLIEGDAGRVRQVVLNLVSNAIKFTDAGRVDVSVELRAGAAPSPRATPVERSVRVTVRDTGIGIDAAALARLFQPFSQVDSSARRRFEGTGLGLTISRRLARLMGGDVQVESVAGAGSTFHFTFALREARAAVDEPAVDAPAVDGLARPIVRSDAPKHVLLVEDNEVNQRVARGLLARLGHRTTVASTGLEALELLAARGPGAFDVALMDMRMPGLDGLETTRRIRAREAAGERLWIVAMTANASADDREACRRAGMDDFVAKPTPLDTLSQALARVGAPGRASSPTPADAREPVDALIDEARIADLIAAVGAPVAELVSDYARDSRRLRALLRAALEATDAPAVARLAHELKGSSGELGAARAVRLAVALEREGRGGLRDASAGAALDALDAGFEETIRALEAAVAARM